jgi:predicted aldo/keto reductase-like oxidoreductase
LGKQWANNWSESLSEWQKMPGQINVLEILRLYNMAVAFDLVDYARSRYNLLGSGGHWFPGRNAAEAHKLDFSASLGRSPVAGLIPSRLTEAHQLLQGQRVTRLQNADA